MALGALAFPVEGREARADVVPAAPAAERFYLPELDLLRLGAFLMVWSAHASFAFAGFVSPRVFSLINGVGSLGVPIFFFLSAYLITELLRRERRATGTVHLGRFYMRRMLRIWPLYFGILGAYGAIGLVAHGFRVEPARLGASVLMLGNWYLARHPGLTTPLRHLWSLSVEEQWYLLWPIAARVLPRTRQLAVCCLCFLAAYAALGYLGPGGSATLAYTAWLNSGVQFQYFALGAATALLLEGRLPALPRTARMLLLAAGGASFVIAASVCAIKSGTGLVPLHVGLRLSGGYLLAAAGTLSLFFALLGARRCWCPRRLVRLGQLSFGLYVFHETAFFLADSGLRALHAPHTPAFAVANRAAALALTVALAWLSFHYWELPFLRMKQRWTLVRSREAA